MNTLPIAQKIQAKYLRAVNNEMIGNYQHSIVVHIMRRIVKLIFETPDFAIDLPIEPRWRDYYITALQISAYLSYVQYEIIADDTIAHITLTDRYRAQILAAATPPPTDTAPAPAPSAPAPAPLAPTTDNATPAPAPAECSERSECSEPTTTPPVLADAATDNAAPSECSESAAATTPAPTPAECSECSEPPSTPPRAAANFRLKAVTTASLKRSLCNSRWQGRRGRPQPSDSQQQRIKSAKTLPCPHKPRPSPLSSSALSRMAPIILISPIAMPPPQPAHPPPHRLSAVLI